MTPFDALLNMSQLTLRARGEWQRSATGHDDIERAVSDCAELLRRDDMPDLVSLAMIEAAITELKIRCGWSTDGGEVIHCCAGVGYANSPDLKAHAPGKGPRI